MNCREFQNDLYEYLEGSLGVDAQAVAEKHLEECAACRQRVQEEREFARALREGMQREVAGLQLPAEVGRRVLAVVAEGGEPRTSNIEHRSSNARAPGLSWMLGFREWVLEAFKQPGVAWPSALAGVAAALVIGWVMLQREAAPTARPVQTHQAGGVVSVQVSLMTPSYTFRREGGMVIDALTTQTTVVNERLQPVLASLQ